MCDKLFLPDEVPAELRDCFEEVEVACGAPWVRVLETKFINQRGSSIKSARKGLDESVGWDQEGCGTNETTTLDWRPSCACIGGDTFTPRPALVLDPFSGSQRTGINALRLGLDYIGIELNPSYCDMGRRLLQSDSPLFNDLSESLPDAP